MARRAWLLALAALCGLGCEADPHEASVRVVLDADTRASTAAVLLEIHEGSCTGPLVSADVLRIGSPMGMQRRLGKGRYGFFAEVRDDGCNAIARGCEEKTLPTDATITINPAPITPESQCAGAMCNLGLCMGDIPPDAGPPERDSGPPDEPDTGPPETCEMEGAVCPTGGVCHDGACCTGCWTGTACELGTSRTACGDDGVDCSACTGSDLCSGGACVPPAGATTHFVLGPLHSFYLEADGRFWSTGNDNYEQLGERDMAATPTQFGETAFMQPFTELAATQFVTCGITSDGALHCWGTNSFGLLGIGDGNTARVENVPFEVAGARWTTISGSSNHICGIRADDQNIYCWGEGTNGKLGNGDTMSRNTPTAIGGSSAWLAVSAGSEHTCAVRSDGELWCWGRNEFGQIGNGAGGAGMSERTPARAGGAVDWTHVAAKGDHTCGIRNGGELYCWGNGMQGRLGTDSTANANTPQRVGTRSDWRAITVGLYHSCGIADQLYCWGFAASVGHASGMDARVPTPPAGGITGWESVAAGWRQTCARAGGTGYCWGINAEGQLGIGNTTDTNRPTMIVLVPTP